MNHEFLYGQKSFFTNIRIVVRHHTHDPHFTTKVLQHAANK